MRVLVRGGVIHTLDPARPRVAAMRLDAGRIIALFDDAPEASSDEQVIDLEGMHALPGLVDAHLHLAALGALRREVDLRRASRFVDAAEAVAAAACTTPAGGWIRGWGWDETGWDEVPSATLLDAIAPDHPVWLSRIDGHAVWLNHRAMQSLAAEDVIARWPEAAGSADDGAPSGLFRDQALTALEARLPAPAYDELRADLEHALSACAREGLVEVHDMAVGEAVWRVLCDLDAEGALPLRVVVYLDGSLDHLEALVASRPVSPQRLRLGGTKHFVDGALGSRGAALFAPYADAPGERGLVVVEAATLRARIEQSHRLGLPAAVHAIGDRGVALALDALARSRSGLADRVEHLQVVTEADLDRLAALGVVASMQPVHFVDDRPWLVARLGDQRAATSYPWRALLERGVRLRFGSDAPVASLSPFAGLAAALGRASFGSETAGRLGLREALTAYADGPLRIGGRGDLTLVASDPLALTPEAMAELRCVGRVVEGVRR